MNFKRCDESIVETIQKFARSVGVSVETVRIWIRQNKIPSVKIGKRRLVNTHKYKKELARED